MSRALGGIGAAVLFTIAATAAHAQTVRCVASLSGADWRAGAQATFVDGQRKSMTLQAEAWAATEFPGEDSDYGLNVATGVGKSPIGWVSLTLRQEGQPGRALLDFASPELFRPGDIVLGRSADGRFPARLRLVADGQALATRDALLAGSPDRLASATPNALIARMGGIDAVAPDNGETVMTAARLSKAAEVRVEVLSAGAPVFAFALRKGAWAEAIGARSSLNARIAADLAAGRCAKG